LENLDAAGVHGVKAFPSKEGGDHLHMNPPERIPAMPRRLLLLASGIVLAIPTLASGTTQIILHAISHEDRVHGIRRDNRNWLPSAPLRSQPGTQAK
jgi:hypothetical protein